MAVKERIKKLLGDEKTGLNEGIYEKEEVMALALLSSIAGESIFLLGPPGVAKSLIARRLKYAYKDAAVFEYLMSRFSTPDEIFGPVSISELKEDKYVRIIDNFLPAAEVVFLDEIWKAGPSIQNALLTILNEKKFRNGKKKGEKEVKIEIDVPMKALISASNELPNFEEAEKQGQSLKALWDRFLVRLVVEGIEDREKFENMIKMPTLSSKDEDTKLKKIITEIISDDDYKEWRPKINQIVIPDNVFNVIQVIRNKIELHNQEEESVEKQIYVSDRRWRKIVRLMRTSAFLNDRKEVDLMDCFLIKHCIWNEEEQKDTVWQFVSDVVEEHGYTLSLELPDIKKELKEFNDEVDKWTHEEIPEEYYVPKEYKINQQEFYHVIIKGIFNYEVDDLIEKDKIIELKKSDKSIETKRYRNDMGDKDTVYIKKSNGENRIMLSDNNCDWKDVALECVKRQRKIKILKQPHIATIKEWDKRIKVVLTKTSNLKSQIESYKSKDLKDIYTNLFVDKSHAEYVEKNLNGLWTQIEQLEVEADRIQDAYTKIGLSQNSNNLALINNEKSI